MLKPKEKNPNFYCESPEEGLYIKEGYTLTEKEYEEVKPYESGTEDEIDEWTGIPVKDLPSIFPNYGLAVVFEDIGLQHIIIFNKKDLETFRNHVEGTTFLYVPFTEHYNKERNMCRRAQFLENGTVRGLKTEKEAEYDFALSACEQIKERVIGKEATVSLREPCSVEGYETNIQKTGVINSIQICVAYGVICLCLYFDNGEEVETTICTDVHFEHTDTKYRLSWAGATARDNLSIELLN